MTEDLDKSEFDGIVSAGYSMDERQLLITWADAYFRALPFAKVWAFNNVPDYLYEQTTPFIELIDSVGFGIMGFFDVQFVNVHLQDELELTEGGKDD